jgi:hypothetical protein
MRTNELAMLAALLTSEPDASNRLDAVMALADRLPQPSLPPRSGRPPKNLREAFEQSDKVWKLIRGLGTPPKDQDAE